MRQSSALNTRHGRYYNLIFSLNEMIREWDQGQSPAARRAVGQNERKKHRLRTQFGSGQAGRTGTTKELYQKYKTSDEHRRAKCYSLWQQRLRGCREGERLGCHRKRLEARSLRSSRSVSVLHSER